MTDFLLSVALSSAGAGIISLILARLIPNKWLDVTFFGLGRALAMVARKRAGVPVWRAVRNILMNSIEVVWNAFRKGAYTEWDDGNEIPFGNPKHSLYKKRK